MDIDRQDTQGWAYAHDIPGCDAFIKIEPITKGWSGDRKYLVETASGVRLLLRVSDLAEYDRKKTEYGMMARVYALGVLTPQPYGFGFCNGGKNVYSLAGWLDGEDAEEMLPTMSETEQYVLGLQAGETLRTMHTLPAPENAEPWGVRFRRKVQERIKFYQAHPIKSESGDVIVRYLQEQQGILDNRPQTFNHGDFNISNMIITPESGIGVIDFNGYHSDHGDPWWEFDSIAWGTEPSAHFYTGLIKGYFNGEPPAGRSPSGELLAHASGHAFFEVFAYYLAYDALAALCDTFIGEQGEPEDGRRHMANILCWFGNMTTPIPAWYLKDFYIKYTDGVPYKLYAPFDFAFLSKYGKVFKVFDDQGSGNICFGMQNGDNRYFIKFAGAPTAKYAGTSNLEGAIERLKFAEQVYRDLSHPMLIRFIDAEDIGGGFLMLFEWTDALCMYHTEKDHAIFMRLPLETRRQIFEEVLVFHAYAAGKGYNALDFYDASIMWDHENKRTVICDIDFYSKGWYEGTAGFWDDSLFASPEERTSGAKVDEISTVYNMGATAFALLSDYKRTPEAWPLSSALYEVVKKAVCDERTERQQSVAQLMAEWMAKAEIRHT